ncbi:Trk family potassium uptake protein [bacterium]|nr:Trk family potassium uptake protein [bacterium]
MNQTTQQQPSTFTPVRILVGSFLAMILVGTGLLMLPVSNADGSGIGFLDALFTSTSAVCVTGLIVVDTATEWSRFGQTVILVLLQFGGIGIISFGALFALMLGQKITFRQRQLISEQYGRGSTVNVLTIIPIVAATTLIIEILGAALLLPVFVPEYGVNEGIWHSVFHAISAFCNAGFSSFSDSLRNYTGNTWLNFIICALIVVGGLGFPVIAELTSRKYSRKRMSLHSRVVLWSSGVLIVIGAIVFFTIETGYDAGFRDLPLHSKFLSSIFQSITARTAGFNTLEIGALAPATIFGLQFLMVIGGSPSGTAGGIKTTTFVASIAAVRSVLTGRSDTQLFDRRLRRETARRALVLTALAGLIIAVGMLFMLLTDTSHAEPGHQSNFLALGFETVSAFGTVGLTTGITSDLAVGQRIVVIFLMFLGRLGPMTFALALSARKPAEHVQYPESDLLTG